MKYKIRFSVLLAVTLLIFSCMTSFCRVGKLINAFFVLRTLESVTNMRNPGYRPTYLCLFIHLIENLCCLQAVTQTFYG